MSGTHANQGVPVGMRITRLPVGYLGLPCSFIPAAILSASNPSTLSARSAFTRLVRQAQLRADWTKVKVRCQVEVARVSQGQGFNDLTARVSTSKWHQLALSVLWYHYVRRAMMCIRMKGERRSVLDGRGHGGGTLSFKCRAFTRSSAPSGQIMLDEQG